MVSFDFMHINSSRVTRIASLAGDEGSEIDLAVLLPLLAPIYRWRVLHYHGSDHYTYTVLVEREAKRKCRTKITSLHYISIGCDIVSLIHQKKRR